MSRRPSTLVLVALLAVAASAPAQVRSPEPRRLEDAARIATIIANTDLMLDVSGAPARDVVEAIAAAIDVPIRGTWMPEHGYDEFGIDPDTPIVLTLERAPANEVLELVIEQCASLHPCTWQIRRGGIEVGTKQALSSVSSREVRMYEARTFMIQPGYNTTEDLKDMDRESFLDHPYTASSITRLGDPEISMLRSPSGGVRPVASLRRDPESLIEEIARAIVETVEPGNWATDDERGYRPDELEPTLFGDPSTKIAQLRVVRDLIVIDAPDFVHRQVFGYPRARVRAPSAEERLARTERATRPGVTLQVLAPERRR